MVAATKVGNDEQKLACPRCESGMSAAYDELECLICGYVYDEATGSPDEGLPPGTLWKDVPLFWRCPVCGAGKEDFEMVEI